MDELETLLSDLVSINSINPDLVPGSPGEAEIAHYIAQLARARRSGGGTGRIRFRSPKRGRDCARHRRWKDPPAQRSHGYGRSRGHASRLISRWLKMVVCMDGVPTI